MLNVHLQGLKFYSFHGFFEEEKLLGNNFVVDIDIAWEEQYKTIEKISQTVDYVNIYNIAAERMKIASPLLESVAMEIGMSSYSQYPFIHNITVKIIKSHPGIPTLQGSLGVSWSKSFK